MSLPNPGSRVLLFRSGSQPAPNSFGHPTRAYLDQIHGTTKRQVAAMFTEERAQLLPLPLEPFRYYQYGERVVHRDGCVEVESAYYSLPPGWIGRLVKLQWDELHVRILHPTPISFFVSICVKNVADIAPASRPRLRRQ